MTSDLTPQVRILREDEKILLPDSLWCAAGFVGLDPWLSFVQKMYGFPVYRVVAETENRIEG